jgi:hypothetical protein
MAGVPLCGFGTVAVGPHGVFRIISQIVCIAGVLRGLWAIDRTAAQFHGLWAIVCIAGVLRGLWAIDCTADQFHGLWAIDRIAGALRGLWAIDRIAD